MGVFDRMYKGSFKGVEFLTSGEVETSGGRETVDHTYMNSDRRFIEDLGAKRQDFSIRVVVRAPRYHQKRDALIKKLEEGGPGVFVHPFRGRFTVVARPYSLIEKTESIGEAVFELSFGVADQNIFPKDSGSSKFVKFLEGVQDAIDNFVGTSFASKFSENFPGAGGYLTDIVEAFEAVKRTVAVTDDALLAFEESINSFNNSINSFVSFPSTLGTALNDMFDKASKIAASSDDSFKILGNLFDFTTEARIQFEKNVKFGNVRLLDTDPVTVLDTDIIAPDSSISDNDKSKMQSYTEQRKENITNVNTINLAMNAGALSQAYVAASLIDFQSGEHLKTISDDLESKYNQLIDVLNDDVLDAFEGLRNEWRVFQNRESVTVEKIITIRVQKQPLTLLLNSLYGSTDKYDEIIEMNSILNPAEISGDIKVLTA